MALADWLAYCYRWPRFGRHRRNLRQAPQTAVVTIGAGALFAAGLAVVIGGITFSGSVVAFLKLSERLIVSSVDEGMTLLAEERMELPAIFRPSFTLGGSGGGIAYTINEYRRLLEEGLQASPMNQVQIDRSLLGWKEFELEVVRDRNDNCIVVCGIENLDPMGVHTGDSITVSPIQTLTDREYQVMRSSAIAVLRAIGVETGGSNVQFAVNPKDGKLLVVEMNPRVSRSSALASKATGFPIAKVAALLAIGYTLDELDNDITGGRISAAFEPTLDYVVTKIPRFDFNKFPSTERHLTTRMQSVGEAMAIGSTFKQSLQKALRSLECGLAGLDPPPGPAPAQSAANDWLQAAATPSDVRLLQLAQAMRQGASDEEAHRATGIDPWFLDQIRQLLEAEQDFTGALATLSKDELLSQFDAFPDQVRSMKALGFSDQQLVRLINANRPPSEPAGNQITEVELREWRWRQQMHPVYKRIDSCAAEFDVETAYQYSTWGDECEARPDAGISKAVILGSGPNRIGQGIEFDYCCVHAVKALKSAGMQTIMINCNPETVSTDYDVTDKLYFEPLTVEDVTEICHVENLIRPQAAETSQTTGPQQLPSGVLSQFGGQTPLQIAASLQAAGIPMLGTSPESIAIAEDRRQFANLLNKFGISQPANRVATTPEEAVAMSKELGYPIMMRPSFVLGGQAMMIVYNETELRQQIGKALQASGDAPVLLDRFLEEATELDIDALCDGEQVLIGGVLEHVEQAGVHSGDSACCLGERPRTISDQVYRQICDYMRILGIEINVRGLMNAQFAVVNEQVYLLELNPRASRTIPFVSKCIGVSLAKLAARISVGTKLAELGATQDFSIKITDQDSATRFAVKEAVLPFGRFPADKPMLGPEMRSTGEVIGIGRSYPEAWEKALLAADTRLPSLPKLATSSDSASVDDQQEPNSILLTLQDSDKNAGIQIARRLITLGFSILATPGTHDSMLAADLPVQRVQKVREEAPHILDVIEKQHVRMVINSAKGRAAIRDSAAIRRSAMTVDVPYITTMSAARLALDVLEERQKSIQSGQQAPDKLAVFPLCRSATIE